MKSNTPESPVSTIENDEDLRDFQDGLEDIQLIRSTFADLEGRLKSADMKEMWGPINKGIQDPLLTIEFLLRGAIGTYEDSKKVVLA